MVTEYKITTKGESIRQMSRNSRMTVFVRFCLSFSVFFVLLGDGGKLQIVPPSLQAQEFLKELLTRSPGPLTKAHEEIDTVQGCIECHQSRTGKDVVHKKCLDCHTDISSRIDKQRGYHRDKPECKNCHADHKGKDHSIFAPSDWLKTFNHDETGYALIGKHTSPDCKSCHSTFRKNSKTSETTSSRTYLEAPTDCYPCHKNDYEHKFSKKDWLNCTQCHSSTIENWKKMAKKQSFNHDKTEFKLEGLHVPVGCKECHKLDSQKKRLTTFAPLNFDKCTDCHADPHKGSFGNDCTTCHNVYRKWKDIIPTRDGKKHSSKDKGFDHSKTKFPLKGYHEAVACDSCHTDPKAKFKVPSDKFDECSDCHGFPHGEQFAKQSCESCHSFTQKFINSTFDLERHSKTKFPLSGKHQVLDCNKCHLSGTFENLSTGECSDCHRNPHDKRQIDKPCSFCHVTTEFSWIQFDHNKNTQFDLTGKHRSVACLSCHVNEGFKNMPANNTNPNCAGCHEDPHGKSMPDTCGDCHRTDGFKPVSKFEHSLIGRWALTGRHAELSCQKCHPQHLLKKYEVPKSQFDSAPTDCLNCHTDVHAGQYGKACDSCHSTSSFSVERGAKVHDLGFFKLEGYHDKMGCNECHRSDATNQGMGILCGTCHQKNDPHLGKLGLTCGDCHSQTAWLPPKFKHNLTGFRLTGAHRYAACSDCHKNQIYEGLPNDCFFCHADSYLKTTNGKSPHDLASSKDCSDCHSQISWKLRRRL